MAPDKRLAGRLHGTFCRFQLRAKSIEAWVEATRTPVDSNVAQEVLEEYSRAIGSELQIARDELRRGQWMVDEAAHAQHDVLCFCIAMWELVQEMVVASGPSAGRLLHWYSRHYLDEAAAKAVPSLVEGTARHGVAEEAAAMKDGSDFWESIRRLALCDCHAEVLELLRRKAEAEDPHVARVCEFLRRTPALWQMDQAQATAAEFNRATEEIREAARGLLRDLPADHPARQVVQVYAGCSQEAFESGTDIARQMGRTWIEDFVYAHAWVFPSMRRAELGELLRAVARRRTSETIDDMDRVFFTVLTLDVPALLELLTNLPDRFPAFFVTHLVDVLYFAGRVPLALELGDGPQVPPRDWHLMAYAKELCSGPRSQKRYAVDYLRAGGSQAAARLLEATAEDYCAEAETDEDMEDALVLLADLDLAAGVGARRCRERAEALRGRGDLAGCLRWACRAEECGASPRSFGISELLDGLARDDLEGLLALLTPPELDEPLEEHPPPSLVALLARSGAASPAWARSGRLYFFSQLARCRALRLAGRPARGHAPALVRLLSAGAVPPSMAEALLEELLPVLSEEGDEAALGAEEVLLVMRYVQAAARDPLRRAQLGPKVAELQRAMGGCFSRAVLTGPIRAGAFPRGSPSRSCARPLELVGA
uniref:Nuclear pore complex protein Nup85 n=1 Tax=Alexandrium monilatum TaxID=311494 RepID=A0A7S4RJW3_9DINO